jgi:hypothetical protein
MKNNPWFVRLRNTSIPQQAASGEMAGADCPAAAAGAVDDRVFTLSISTIKSAVGVQIRKRR